MDEQTTTVIYLNQFEAHGLDVGYLVFDVQMMKLKRDELDLDLWDELAVRGKA